MNTYILPIGTEVSPIYSIFDETSPSTNVQLTRYVELKHTDIRLLFDCIHKLSNGQYITMCQYEYKFPHPIKNCLGFVFWLALNP